LVRDKGHQALTKGVLRFYWYFSGFFVTQRVMNPSPFGDKEEGGTLIDEIQMEGAKKERGNPPTLDV
jgi:hypothetical protein